MDVSVEAAGGENLSLARNHFGAGTDHDCHARLNVGVAGLADRGDAAFLEADIGFHDAPVIEDQYVGYNGIDGTLFGGDLALPHAVADDFTAAEFYFLAIGGEVLLHLNNEVRICQPHAIASGWPEHSGIGGTV